MNVKKLKKSHHISSVKHIQGKTLKRTFKIYDFRLKLEWRATLFEVKTCWTSGLTVDPHGQLFLKASQSIQLHYFSHVHFISMWNKEVGRMFVYLVHGMQEGSKCIILETSCW